MNRTRIKPPIDAPIIIPNVRGNDGALVTRISIGVSVLVSFCMFELLAFSESELCVFIVSVIDRVGIVVAMSDKSSIVQF